MKKALLLTLVASTALCLGDRETEAHKAQLNKAYQTGVNYLKAGDFDNAERYLKAVLKKQPNHGNATYHLMKLKDYRAATQGSLSKNQLKGVVIDKIEFDEVPLNEVIEGLKLLIDRSNGDEKPAPNMALKDPNHKISGKPVSISLSNIPAEVALKYVLECASARVKYGEHIISILPR